jgi:hypothetical protein
LSGHRSRPDDASENPKGIAGRIEHDCSANDNNRTATPGCRPVVAHVTGSWHAADGRPDRRPPGSGRTPTHRRVRAHRTPNRRGLHANSRRRYPLKFGKTPKAKRTYLCAVARSSSGIGLQPIRTRLGGTANPSAPPARHLSVGPMRRAAPTILSPTRSTSQRRADAPSRTDN